MAPSAIDVADGEVIIRFGAVFPSLCKTMQQPTSHLNATASFSVRPVCPCSSVIWDTRESLNCDIGFDDRLFDDDDTISTMFASAGRLRERRRTTMNATIASTMSNARIPPAMPPISAPSLEDIDNVVERFKSSSVMSDVVLLGVAVDVGVVVVDGVVADDDPRDDT